MFIDRRSSCRNRECLNRGRIGELNNGLHGNMEEDRISVDNLDIELSLVIQLDRNRGNGFLRAIERENYGKRIRKQVLCILKKLDEGGILHWREKLGQRSEWIVQF